MLNRINEKEISTENEMKAFNQMFTKKYPADYISVPPGLLNKTLTIETTSYQLPVFCS